MDAPKSDVISWAEKAVEKLHLTDCDFSIKGKTDKTDGYSSEVVFVTANGTTRENKRISVDLVVKRGKSSQNLKQRELVSNSFQTEIRIYDKIFPAFEKIQLEKNIVNVFDAVPKCYLVPGCDQTEVLVLENLKQSGYELHDRMQTLNFDHLKVVLEAYGKLHALSFALRDQKVEEFNRISNFEVNPFEKSMKDDSVRGNFDSATTDAIKLLRENGHEGLCKKYENVLAKGAGEMLLDLVNEMGEQQQRVIIHGDCWNNNLMFRYEGDEKAAPSKVKILDWQISAVRSPVFDLSYFIYANSSQRELERFDELMEIYYTAFSDFLKQLGSDPEHLFTFDDLKRHWKKYSLFGFLFTPLLLKFALCSGEEAPALEDLKQDQEFGSFMNIAVSDKDAFYKRIRAMASHYFECKF